MDSILEEHTPTPVHLLSPIQPSLAAPSRPPPRYRGFNGSVVEVPTRNAAGKSYAVSGTAVPAGDNALTITELPVRTWTQSYKEFLETLMKPPAAAARGAGTAAGAAAAAAGGPGQEWTVDWCLDEVDLLCLLTCLTCTWPGPPLPF